MRKIKIGKRPLKVDLEKWFGEDFKGAWIKVWADPSRPIINKLFRALSTPEEIETDEDADEFFEAATKFFIDSNIAGLEFDTVEATKESFEHEDLPWLTLYKVIIMSLAHVVNESDELKKTLGRSTDSNSSTSDSDQKDDQ